MHQPSVAWKKIVDQLVLQKTQMKASFKTEIRRIRRKFLFRQISHWCFFCASAKLSHRYNTRANHSRVMEHLEQENRDLEEIARLTAMMESVLAAQSQFSLTPATPPHRTVISEVVTSTIPAIAAHFAPAMPSGFPWGMPPNFLLEGFAPTFASMSASSPIMFVPPPAVHTLPRVEDTIYHSEPS
ncbi:hypothetical protein KIW84_024914 [Lathyrus oleraceus]|uniref:Uncharacterized protein n=1 Tax=Pisum sativum TaxID=3888 RepID=A0A9D4YI14_PEA|nr:hypothetical protein KIW84_024914 [Pisum sativum]